MKLVQASASLALLGSLYLSAPNGSTALKCGIAGVTNQCIGDNDVRYDSDASYNLEDQDELWGKISGLYYGTLSQRLPDFSPYSNRTFAFGSFDYSNPERFVNLTVDGSRFVYNAVFMAKSNTPGGPGMVLPTEAYYTSTFEKDGGAELNAFTNGFWSGDDLPSQNSKLTPIGGKILQGVNDFAYETYYCTTPDCSLMQVYFEIYTQPIDGAVSLEFRQGGLMTRVDLSTWKTKIENAYAELNIPTMEDAQIKLPYLYQPFPSKDANLESTSGYKYSEEEWMEYDPVFGTSPYAEPDGVLTGGFIAGITIGSVIVAVAIFYFIYKRGVEAREKRVKAAVAKSIAKNMEFSHSKNLSPSELETMFKKIDTDGSGDISKDEIKNLVDDAGVANMSEKDYAILFSSIDINGNGTLDFAEFSAFFAAICNEHEEFDNA